MREDEWGMSRGDEGANRGHDFQLALFCLAENLLRRDLHGRRRLVLRLQFIGSQIMASERETHPLLLAALTLCGHPTERVLGSEALESERYNTVVVGFR